MTDVPQPTICDAVRSRAVEMLAKDVGASLREAAEMFADEAVMAHYLRRAEEDLASER
jgi:hypothetical protein